MILYKYYNKKKNIEIDELYNDDNNNLKLDIENN